MRMNLIKYIAIQTGSWGEYMSDLIKKFQLLGKGKRPATKYSSGLDMKLEESSNSIVRKRNGRIVMLLSIIFTVIGTSLLLATVVSHKREVESNRISALSDSISMPVGSEQEGIQVSGLEKSAALTTEESIENDGSADDQDSKESNDLKISQSNQTKGKREQEEDEATKEEHLIVVDIKGAVKKPGIYEVTDGQRVYDLLRLAEGVTSDGDTTAVNLAQLLIDECIVYIPTYDEVIEHKEETDGAEQLYAHLPFGVSDGVNAIATENAADTTKDAVETDSLPPLINLNSATPIELETIPGIGPKKALDIITHREEVGGFKHIEELMDVPGIGEKTFEKLEAYITVD